MRFKLPVSKAHELHGLMAALFRMIQVRKKRTPETFERMWVRWSDEERKLFISDIDTMISAYRPLLMAEISVEAEVDAT